MKLFDGEAHRMVTPEGSHTALAPILQAQGRKVHFRQNRSPSIPPAVMHTSSFRNSSDNAPRVTRALNIKELTNETSIQTLMGDPKGKPPPSAQASLHVPLGARERRVKPSAHTMLGKSAFPSTATQELKRTVLINY